MNLVSWERFIAGQVPFRRPIAATIGVFDGVHRGHVALLSRVVSHRGSHAATVFTFRENPKALTRPRAFEGNIFTLDQKLRVFRELGVDFVVLIDFSGDFGKLSGKEFVGFLRDRGKLRYLAIGSDFRCGYGLDTDAVALRGLNAADGIPTDIVPPVEEEGVPISSSRIRTAITTGDLVEAAVLLGRNFVIDLRSVPLTPEADAIGHDARGMGRITPPNGRYPAIVFSDESSQGFSADVSVRDGVVWVPTNSPVDRVEFLTSVARSV